MATEKQLIDVNAAKEYVDTMFPGDPVLQWLGRTMLDKLPKVDAVGFPCNVGDTVYGQFGNYGKKIHECKVIKSKVCQFRDRTLHYFLDVEFNIIDPYYRDGRLMRCMQQAVFGEYFGSWDRVYLTREEAEAALCNHVYGERKNNG